MMTSHPVMPGLLVLLLAITFCGAQNPGARIRINQRGLDHGGDVIVKMFEKKLLEDKIKDINGKSGSVSYSVTNIKVNSLSSPVSTITVDTTGISHSLTIANFKVSASWTARYKQGWIDFSTGGGISVDVNNLHLNHKVTLGKTDDGKATMTSVSCIASLGDLNLRLTGGLAWLINPFLSNISDNVREALQPKICPLVTNLINTQGDAAVRDTDLLIPVGREVELDYRLVTAPVFASNYMDINSKGEGLWNGEDSQTSLTPAPLTLNTAASKMLYVEISDYTFNTLSEVLYRHNKLQHLITKQVPLGGNPVHVIASVKATAAPVVHISPARISVMVSALTNVRLTVSGFTQTLAIATNATLAATARIRGNRLIFNVTSFVTDNLQVGAGLSLDLNDLINNGLMSNLIPLLNQNGAAGIKLPVFKFASYVNPSLEFRHRSLLVSTDVMADILRPATP